MITTDPISQIVDSTAVDTDGSKLGKVGEVYLDDATGAPEWATVNTGLFGTKETFVPLAQAAFTGDELRFPYAKELVKGAPRVHDENGHLSQEEEAELYRYYGLSYSQLPGDSGLPATPPAPAATATDDAMTRSEERLRVGTQRVDTGRARLRKYVVTENVTQTVPVTREQVRIEREPITDANVGNAMDGPAISEEEHEITLTEERPVVQKETVPVERVRLDKETVTEQVRVDEQLRKEEVELIDEQDRTRR